MADPEILELVQRSADANADGSIGRLGVRDSVSAKAGGIDLSPAAWRSPRAGDRGRHPRADRFREIYHKPVKWQDGIALWPKRPLTAAPESRDCRKLHLTTRIPGIR